MKAVACTSLSSLEVLAPSDMKSPASRKGHLLVRVHVVSINPLDGKIRRGEVELLSGTCFPKIPGRDFMGIVEEVDPGVSGFEVEDPVFGGLGSVEESYLAELVSIPGRTVHA